MTPNSRNFNSTSVGLIQSVGTTAAKVFNQRGSRKLVSITNTHGSQTLAVGPDSDTSVADSSTYFTLLAAGESFEWYGTHEYWVDASGASTTFEAIEGYDSRIS